MALLTPTIRALNKLVDAVGLKGHPISKLVISCAVNEPIRLYVTGYIDTEQLDKVADAIELLSCKDVQVSDDGEIKADDPVLVKRHQARESI